MSIALLLSFISCVKYGPVQQQYADLKTEIEKTEVDEFSKKCAPNQMALVFAHKEFAELEFTQGDVFRAEDHLVIAMENVGLALEEAEKCRPKDTDGDGFMDDVDQCPEEAETKNGYQDEDGCPEKDSDLDGIFDDVDQCVTDAEDKDLFEDEDGCPEEDNDADGIVDADDKCPNIPEDYDAFQDEDGCPEETGDTDQDGIFDDVDRCITRPETINNYLDQDGCPDRVPKNVRVTKNQIVIEEKILFQTGKAVILRKSYGILNSVGQVLRDYSKIKVRVDGHTDSRGSDKYNLKLSDRRAKSVRDHLVNVEGIDISRLESKGFGESVPLEDNTTNEGQEKNRRVEFTILQGME